MKIRKRTGPKRKAPPATRWRHVTTPPTPTDAALAAGLVESTTHAHAVCAAAGFDSSAWGSRKARRAAAAILATRHLEEVAQHRGGADGETDDG